MVHFRGLVIRRFCKELLRILLKLEGPKSLRIDDLEEEYGPSIPSHQFGTSPLQSLEELTCDESKAPEA
jgi:hypothetical protein